MLKKQYLLQLEQAQYPLMQALNKTDKEKEDIARITILQGTGC